MTRRDYTPFVEAYLGGRSCADLAREVGINPGTMYRGLASLGLVMRGISESRRGKPTKARGRPNLARRRFDYDEAARLYEAGDSLSAIAERLGADDEAVRRALALVGVPRRRRGAGDGSANHQYKGGIRVRRDGYVYVRGHTNPPLRHRIVAAESIGRPLAPGEVVHHRNHIKGDDRPENLQVCASQSEHMRLYHHQEQIR